MLRISRVVVVVCLLLVAASTSAFAQAAVADVPMTITVDHFDPSGFAVIPVAPTRPKLLMGLYVGAAGWQAMDLYTTSRGLKAGAFETNDAIRTGNGGTTIALKMAMTGASIALAEKMWKKNKALAIATMIGNNVLSAMVVANNYRVINKLERK